MFGIGRFGFAKNDLKLGHLETANLVAALSTTKLGTQPVYLHELQAHRAAADYRLKVVEHGTQLIRAAKAAGRKIVVTNGVFDLYHEGHFNLLMKAKQDPKEYLVVLVNNDHSVARIKENRPFDPVGWRTKMVASVPTVDLVMEFTRDEPTTEIWSMQPDVLVKGDEYDGVEIPGVQSVGELRLVPMASGSNKRLYHTTDKAAFIAERVKGVTGGEVKEKGHDTKEGVSPGKTGRSPKGSSRVSSSTKGGSPRRAGVPKRKAGNK